MQTIPLKEITDTASAQGGKSVWMQLSESGATALSYKHWVITHTPSFLEWFGHWNDTDRMCSGINVPESREPQVVFHGTHATKTTVMPNTAGDDQARRELQQIASDWGVADWTSVAPVAERWVGTLHGDRFGVNAQRAQALRTLHKQAIGTASRSREDLGFNAFNLPAGAVEVGVHFGSKTQALARGEPFPFFLRINNPLVLPDLGTWGSKHVLDQMKQRRLPVNEDDYRYVLEDGNSAPRLREILMVKGYDGVIYENEAEGDGYSYIALSDDSILFADNPTGGSALALDRALSQVEVLEAEEESGMECGF